MATTQLKQAAPTYESHKLQEVFRHYDVRPTDDDVAAVGSSAPAPEAARTRRFRRELNQVDLGTIVVLLAGLALIVVASILFSS